MSKEKKIPRVQNLLRRTCTPYRLDPRCLGHKLREGDKMGMRVCWA